MLLLHFVGTPQVRPSPGTILLLPSLWITEKVLRLCLVSTSGMPLHLPLTVRQSSTPHPHLIGFVGTSFPTYSPPLTLDVSLVFYSVPPSP